MKILFSTFSVSGQNNNGLYRPSFGIYRDYGIPSKLPENLHGKIADIHKNINFIKSFFDGIKKNKSPYASFIKKYYTDLIPRKDSAYTFKLSDGNSISVMQGQSKKNLMWIQINDGSKFNGIILDGNDRAVANYSPNHPHMLPRELKYMSDEKMAEINPQGFIDIAFEKIKGYAKFIKNVKEGKTNIETLYKEKIAVQNEQWRLKNKPRRKLIKSESESVNKEKKNKALFAEIYKKVFTEEFEKELRKKISTVWQNG